APFAERVRACQAAVARARDACGTGTVYAPSLVGTPRRLAEQARIALDAGIRMVLIAPMLVGIPAFVEFVEQFPELAILAHPAFGGAGRINPAWLFGRFFRLLGADAIIFPNYGGRFSYDRQRCLDLVAAARASWSGIRPALPVPAGGMSLERTSEIVGLYGDDVMLLIGGALLTAGDALEERSRDFVRAIKAGSTAA
ncbi:MAG: ribulose 1,5-bisphosphate carboxylase, partial [Candidatus Eremiobacteraeota bacterium]|nr:ribulose 1,5-bisphosphate carboxylase [Candidatus Eremiobacteraeota bacterium]